MSAKQMWWVFVVCAIVIASFPRFETRQARSLERSDESLSVPIRGLLLDAGASDFKVVRWGALKSGIEFRLAGCAEPMTVVVFSITFVADSLARHYIKPGYRHSFQYQDLSHDGFSRVHLTAVWAWQKLKHAVNRSSYRDSSKQILIVWPKQCEAPAIDWSRAWLLPAAEA